MERHGVIIQGTCTPAFAKLREEFAENFRSRGEKGAAVAVYLDGRMVADLWGGVANPGTGDLWAEDTIVCMMSVGKAMAALCLWRLIDRGKIDLDARVSKYWPEFGRAGKEAITVRLLLGGLAGLVYADHAPAGSAFDWDVMVGAMERQEPVWKPGTVGAYHSTTAGTLFGELVRRVDGRGIDVFFAQEVAGPLGLDYKFGLGDSDMRRVAPLLPNPDSVMLNQIGDPSSKLGRAWRIFPKERDVFNSEAFRKAVFPSANGHGNARAIARVYSALSQGGQLNGYHLLSRSLIEELRTPAWEGICGLTDRPFRYGLGFFVSAPPLLPFGANGKAFGHPGAGGAIGLADPEAGISFSYSPNLMCAGAGVGDRCEALINAAFSCL